MSEQEQAVSVSERYTAYRWLQCAETARQLRKLAEVIRQHNLDHAEAAEAVNHLLVQIERCHEQDDWGSADSRLVPWSWHPGGLAFVWTGRESQTAAQAQRDYHEAARLLISAGLQEVLERQDQEQAQLRGEQGEADGSTQVNT